MTKFESIRTKETRKLQLLQDSGKINGEKINNVRRGLVDKSNRKRRRISERKNVSLQNSKNI
jgi:hypothetical protein